MDPQEAHEQGPWDLAAGPLCRRLRRAGQGDPRTRPRATRAGRRGAGTDGASTVGGQDEDHPHRRGVRLPGLPHPAAAPGRHEPAVRLHLPVQEGPCGHHRQGADPDPPNSEPITCGPAVPAQSGAPGLVRLLPPRGVQPHLRLPGGLRLASDPPLAAAPAPPYQLEDPAPSLPSRMAPDAGRGGDVPAQHGADLPLPLPGPPHPDPMGDRDGTDRKARGMNSWRAGCVETRTSGSEGGLRKRTGRKTGTAPQPDPYLWRDQAENPADSLAKGDRVWVTGRLGQCGWETPEGDKRSVTEIEGDAVGG